MINPILSPDGRYLLKLSTSFSHRAHNHYATVEVEDRPLTYLEEGEDGEDGEDAVVVESSEEFQYRLETLLQEKVAELIAASKRTIDEAAEASRTA